MIWGTTVSKAEGGRMTVDLYLDAGCMHISENRCSKKLY